GPLGGPERLADLDRGHVGPDEQHVLHFEGDGRTAHPAGEHPAGELRDRVPPEEPRAAAGRPDRVGAEQADELLGELVVLGVLHRGDDPLDRRDLGGGPLPAGRRPAHPSLPPSPPRPGSARRTSRGRPHHRSSPSSFPSRPGRTRPRRGTGSSPAGGAVQEAGVAAPARYAGPRSWLPRTRADDRPFSGGCACPNRCWPRWPARTAGRGSGPRATRWPATPGTPSTSPRRRSED